MTTSHSAVSFEGESQGPRHVPVLPTEVLAGLAPKPGQTFVDATAGGGGHARLIAERLAPGGRLIAIDQDPAMLDRARERLAEVADVQVHLQYSNFDQLRGVLDELAIDRVDGVIADLGFASDQMDDQARGLSFQREGPLDMRLNPGAIETAADLLADLNERELAEVFWRYGEERQSRRVARRVVEARKQKPLRTTTELAELVRRCVRRSGGIDPATRVFQALRIAVNDELGALERFLKVLPKCLKPGGRAAIISFHSLEDRRVKQAFRDRALWKALSKKPLTATDEEMQRNPRSRSAKLRIAACMLGMEAELVRM